MPHCCAQLRDLAVHTHTHSHATLMCNKPAVPGTDRQHSGGSQAHSWLGSTLLTQYEAAASLRPRVPHCCAQLRDLAVAPGECVSSLPTWWSRSHGCIQPTGSPAALCKQTSELRSQVGMRSIMGRSGPKRLDSEHCGVALTTPSPPGWAFAAVPHPHSGRCLSTLVFCMGRCPPQILLHGSLPTTN